jgi:extradiol dioxygenase family protein
MTAAANRAPFHLAIPVDDIEAARHFYGDVMGLESGRSSARWTDWNLFGHQLVTHEISGRANVADPVAGTNAVDGHEVPVPHFGIVLPVVEFQELAARLDAMDVDFVIRPYLRFAGEPGEQWTMFFLDPSGNALEFKAFVDIERLFAT